MENLPQFLVDQFTERANAEKDGGGSIIIDYLLPAIDIVMSSGNEYYFQEHEAQELLDEVPENIDPKDYILAIAQNW